MTYTRGSRYSFWISWEWALRRPKHVEFDVVVNKCLHTAASSWSFLLTLNHDARNHEFKKKRRRNFTSDIFKIRLTSLISWCKHWPKETFWWRHCNESVTSAFSTFKSVSFSLFWNAYRNNLHQEFDSQFECVQRVFYEQ
jgi:hypothetical protein